MCRGTSQLYCNVLMLAHWSTANLPWSKWMRLLVSDHKETDFPQIWGIKHTRGGRLKTSFPTLKFNNVDGMQQLIPHPVHNNARTLVRGNRTRRNIHQSEDLKSGTIKIETQASAFAQDKSTRLTLLNNELATTVFLSAYRVQLWPCYSSKFKLKASQTHATALDISSS